MVYANVAEHFISQFIKHLAQNQTHINGLERQNNYLCPKDKVNVGLLANLKLMSLKIKNPEPRSLEIFSRKNLTRFRSHQAKKFSFRLY